MRKLISLFLSSFSSTMSSAVSDFERLLEILTIPKEKTITFKIIDFISMVFVINIVTNTMIDNKNSAIPIKKFLLWYIFIVIPPYVLSSPLDSTNLQPLYERPVPYGKQALVTGCIVLFR